MPKKKQKSTFKWKVDDRWTTRHYKSSAAFRLAELKSEIIPFPINVRKNVHILNMLYMELKSEITPE